MPLQETSGAASYDAFGGGAAVAPVYIEQIFSTWLYTGNGSTQTITNGIDLSTYGGMVWRKQRDATYDNIVADTVRGQYSTLFTNTTAAASGSSYIGNFSTTGFDVVNSASSNPNGSTNVSWTFRKQPKFFDVVTYTGNGANRTIAHNLGSIPGCIIVKRTDTAADWQVYHRSLANTEYLVLNSTAAKATGTTRWNSTTPTSTVFSIGTDTTVNANGGTYVAYLFAHDAGGFGLTGTDNVISCGSLTMGAGITTATLGYEPQWLLIKGSNNANSWWLVDNMRGLSQTGYSRLIPDDSTAETAITSPYISITSTGFTMDGSIFGSGNSFIYIAIRRGPMKTPTSGTSVFGLNARTGTGANATVTGSAGVSDAVLIKNRGSAVGDLFASRLTGTGYLETSSTAAEVAAGTTILQANPWDVMDGVKVGTTSTITNASSNTYINYLFDRAPGFFDEVCYTGTGGSKTVAHNLGVAPELMIVKVRNKVDNWVVYDKDIGATNYLYLNFNSASAAYSGWWNNTAPTASVFTVGPDLNDSLGPYTYVAYLFASCPGVSKVTNFTGNGSTQTINCGFTTGARFVLIKATSTTGNWLVFDTARGMTTSTDPWLALNSTAAESATTGACTTTSVGFTVDESKLTGVNTNGVSYIALAVA